MAADRVRSMQRDKVTVKELEDQRADTTYLVMLPDLQDGASVSG